MWMMVPVIFIIKVDTSSEEEEIANPFRFTYNDQGVGRYVHPVCDYLLCGANVFLSPDHQPHVARSHSRFAWLSSKVTDDPPPC